MARVEIAGDTGKAKTSGTRVDVVQRDVAAAELLILQVVVGIVTITR